jgi:hypothetical protein
MKYRLEHYDVPPDFCSERLVSAFLMTTKPVRLQKPSGGK